MAKNKKSYTRFFITNVFQFVFAKLNLAFNADVVFLVHRLPCINRIDSIVHVLLLSLSETELPTIAHRPGPKWKGLSRKTTVKKERKKTPL